MEMADEVRRLKTDSYICGTCGVQQFPSSNPPAHCQICIDHRQFVPKTGQVWTKGVQLQESGYRNTYQKHEPNLFGIATVPKFAIGQRAFLIQTPHGNLLWDCVSLIDEATVDIVQGLGGIRAIAISHPHFYAANAQWSVAFGGIPVYINERDKKWVQNDHSNVIYWNSKTLKLWDGLEVVHLGGHFAGASILHWSHGANGKGVIISGDILQVAMDRRSVSIMRSFPNYIPLSIAHARRILAIMETLDYDRLYGAFWDLELNSDAKALVRSSLDRYAFWIQSEEEDE